MLLPRSRSCHYHSGIAHTNTGLCHHMIAKSTVNHLTDRTEHPQVYTKHAPPAALTVTGYLGQCSAQRGAAEHGYTTHRQTHARASRQNTGVPGKRPAKTLPQRNHTERNFKSAAASNRCSHACLNRVTVLASGLLPLPPVIGLHEFFDLTAAFDNSCMLRVENVDLRASGMP